MTKGRPRHPKSTSKPIEHEELRKILATRVREYRARIGLSQEAFADTCGLHRTYIGGIERAERNVTLSTLATLAAALGVTPCELLDPARGGKDA